jgi:hypothetical protein
MASPGYVVRGKAKERKRDSLEEQDRSNSLQLSVLVD